MTLAPGASGVPTFTESTTRLELSPPPNGWSGGCSSLSPRPSPSSLDEITRTSARLIFRRPVAAETGVSTTRTRKRVIGCAPVFVIVRRKTSVPGVT